MVSSFESSIKNIFIKRTQELDFCKEVQARFILLRNTSQLSTNITIQTLVFLTQTRNGTNKGSKVNTKSIWRMASRILSILDLLFLTTELRWTLMCLKGTKESEFTWTRTNIKTASLLFILETSLIVQIQVMWRSFKIQLLLDLKIIKTAASSLETTM